MKFLNILKTVGGVAAAMAPTTAVLVGGPALGATVNTVIGAVLAVEQPGASGAEKKAVAMRYLAVASTGIVTLIEQTTGRELLDEAAFQRGLERMVDAAVDLLNAFGALKDEGK
jgi:hypothetical protein